MKQAKKSKNTFKRLVSFPGLVSKSKQWKDKDYRRDTFADQGYGSPSVFHATVIIFLEYFAWGLLTGPMLNVLGETFPTHTFLMNGLVQGVKGFLSFLSAPLIGALSDVWGRKSFLLLTVGFTCLPIPLLRFNPWWFFGVLSISGVFAVTFSVVFAYVADCTDENDRTMSYGLVSATFAASLIVSPAIGSYLQGVYNDNVVIALATAVAMLDILFILLIVPESLPERMRPATWGAPVTWEQADPFNSLRKVGNDPTVLLLSVAVFLSYLPEAGQYSCMFLYLKKVMYFDSEDVATFIAVAGILSVVAQTSVLALLKKNIGLKHCILVGLVFQALQLTWYGLGSQKWMLWAAGSLASMSSLTYPAISSLVSCSSESDQQGAVQGIITGIRGLCNGLGPALFGLMFFIFHVDLDSPKPAVTVNLNSTLSKTSKDPSLRGIGTGAPFLFGAGLVILALLLTLFLPEKKNVLIVNSTVGSPKHPNRPSFSEDGQNIANTEANEKVPMLFNDS
ncbi:hippocampus abundant transcript 1 protein-like [Xenia sp. Carnegie-2017]|uniref:hippocampus abundant transcript 1 protein-like n=1 Tax=Xenia sp. Carnegie-2017 TaxID=2897299 RepID=UPI001F0448E7|nr:hippocampus abundant transcript 1 protein-like [Xenia sp. Carnegie-2017]